MSLSCSCEYDVSGVLAYVEQYTTADGTVHTNPNSAKLEQYAVSGLGGGTVLD